MTLSSWFKGGRKELIVPESIKTDPKAQEILRAWVAGGSLHVSLRPDAWSDPVAWGVVLADLVKHVAKAYQLQKQFDEAEVLRRIKAVMDAELPSSIQPSGQILN